MLPCLDFCQQRAVIFQAIFKARCSALLYHMTILLEKCDFTGAPILRNQEPRGLGGLFFFFLFLFWVLNWCERTCFLGTPPHSALQDTPKYRCITPYGISQVHESLDLDPGTLNTFTITLVKRCPQAQSTFPGQEDLQGCGGAGGIGVAYQAKAPLGHRKRPGLFSGFRASGSSS